jgi:hypothetical protein
MALTLNRKVIIIEKNSYPENPTMQRTSMLKHLGLTLLPLKNMLQKASTLFIFPGLTTAPAV